MVRRAEGYIALIAVLVAGAVSTAAILAIMVIGTYDQQASLISQQSMQARNLAVACTEDALQMMRANRLFDGTSGFSLGQGSCTFTVVRTSSSGRTIDTTATVGPVTRRIYVTGSATTTAVTISTWEEVE